MPSSGVLSQLLKIYNIKILHLFWFHGTGYISVLNINYNDKIIISSIQFFKISVLYYML
jgi:hypothetical protein